MTRILDCGPEEFREMGGEELLEAIRRSEGRTVMAEILHPAPPLVPPGEPGEAGFPVVGQDARRRGRRASGRCRTYRRAVMR